MTMAVRRVDRGIPYDGEAAVALLASSLESGKAARGIGHRKVVSTGLLEDVEGFGLGVHGRDRGVELAELVFVFVVASNVGSDPPIAEVDGGVTQELVVQGATLEELDEP